MQVTTPAFPPNGIIPSHFANVGFPGGENVSIPLAYGGTPPSAVSVALAFVDLAPVANGFVHWLVVGLPVGDVEIDAGASPGGMPAGAVELPTSYGTPQYGGPRPPAGTGEHEYELTVYALDESIDAASIETLDDFARAIKGHVVDQAAVSGYLGRE